MTRNPARSWAYRAMCRLSGRMTDIRKADPVAYADLRTSMNDWRAAFCFAVGREPDRDGYALPLPGQLALDFEEAS